MLSAMNKFIDKEGMVLKNQFTEKSECPGLTETEVSSRIDQGLVNSAPKSITKTTGQIVRDNVCTMFNLLNILIGISLALVGAWTNMFFLVIILANVLIGIVQEIHAKRLVDRLSLLSAPKTTVIRGGKPVTVPVEELVMDDITVLSLGKQICADAVVVSGEVEVNESLLTGESDSIVKRPGDTLLSGSFVVCGTCRARVTHVGAENFVVKLALGAKRHKKITSQLLSAMQKVTRFTGLFIIPAGILLFLEAYLVRSDSVFNAVVLSAAALLGMLPKGLVLMISVSLATGVVKLAKENVLVQEMHSIEALAHVDVLCLDKTGTITEGKMQVLRVVPISGSGLPLPLQEALGCFTCAMEDCNATFLALKEQYSCWGNHYPVLHRMPFSSERKWSAVTLAGFGTLVLGAPEFVIGKEFAPTAEMSQALAAGQRVLLVGYTCENMQENTLPKVAAAGFVCLQDPVRENAVNTLDFFREQGVQIKVISGDNPQTVASIARQAGLAEPKGCIDMSQVQTHAQLEKAAAEHQIFGRVTPGQKKDLIQALKAQGHTVAMTGDGVNDVLALREADCAIAMGAGSDAAKQISQFVLVDSDFSTLPKAVMEGRRVIRNITRVGGIFFIKTLYSILLSVFSIVTLSPFPFIPIQITLIDAVAEAFPAFVLSFEPTGEKPRGNFLGTVIRKAYPYALFIVTAVLSVTWLAPVLGFSETAANTWKYLLTAIITLTALVQSCRPMNKLRVLVCLLAVIGFLLAVFLFADILCLQFVL